MKIFRIGVFAFVSLCMSPLQASDAIKEPQIGGSIFLVPDFQIRPDTNDPSRIVLDRNTINGAGVGVRLYKRNFEQRPDFSNVKSISFYSLDLQEEGTEEKARGYSLSYTFLGERHFDIVESSISPFFGPLIGVGISNYNFKNQSSNEVALTGEVGLQAGLYITNKIRLSLGGAFHIWGFPIETVARGGYSFVEVGMSY